MIINLSPTIIKRRNLLAFNKRNLVVVHNLHNVQRKYKSVGVAVSTN